MLLYLIRHGLTVMNEQGLFNGNLEDGLSETGQEQVEKLGKKFATIPLDAIWTSDMMRTKATAQGIIKYHPAVSNYTTDNRLREKDMGEFEGQSGQETRKLAEAQGMSRGQFSETDPRIEHGPAIVERFNSRYNEHIKDSGHEAVAVVSHGATIRIILAHIAGMTPRDYLAVHKGIENTGVSIISTSGTKPWRIATFNDFSHLTSIY